MPPAGEAGFTLLELLVVVAVLALVLVLAPAAPPFGRPPVDPVGVARDIQSSLRLARSEARASGRPVLFRLDAVGRWYGTEGGPRRPLQNGVVLETRTAEAMGEAAIGFHPDGSSTGGRIAVVVGDRRRGVAVDWITGRAVLDP